MSIEQNSITPGNGSSTPTGRSDAALHAIKQGDARHGELKQGDMKHGDMKHGENRHSDMKHHDLKSQEQAPTGKRSRESGRDSSLRSDPNISLAAATATQVSLPAAVLERYMPEKELGRGSMGVVYRAHDTRLARQVAMKVLYPIRAKGEDLKQMEERFLREARLAARLVHPNIVTVFDILHADGQWFLVMELVEGRTLRQVLRDEEEISVWSACDWILQAARALDCAHLGGVIHRDIKPENLLLQKDGRVRIMDFGVALSVDSPRLTAAGQTMGTPAYFAPELLHSKPSTPSSDLFALGVMFYELVTSNNPYAGGRPIDILMRIANTRPAPLDTLVSDLPPGLSDVVEKLMQPDPTQRYESARDVIRDLERLVVGATDVVEDGLAVSTLSGKLSSLEVRNTLVPGLSPEALQSLRQSAANLQAQRQATGNTLTGMTPPILPGAGVPGTTLSGMTAPTPTDGFGTFATRTTTSEGPDGSMPVAGLNTSLASGQKRVWAALAGLSLLVGGSWAFSSSTMAPSGTSGRPAVAAPASHAQIERPLSVQTSSAASSNGMPSISALASTSSAASQVGGAVMGQPMVGPAAPLASTSELASPGGGTVSTAGPPGGGAPGASSPERTVAAVEKQRPFESGLVDTSAAVDQPSINTQKVAKQVPEWSASECAAKGSSRKTVRCLGDGVQAQMDQYGGVKATARAQKLLLPLLKDPAVARQAWALAPKMLPRDQLIAQSRSLLKSTRDYDERQMAASVLASLGKPVSAAELHTLELSDAECATRREAAFYFRAHPTPSAKAALQAAYLNSYQLTYGAAEAEAPKGPLAFVIKALKPKDDKGVRKQCDLVAIEEALKSLK